MSIAIKSNPQIRFHPDNFSDRPYLLRALAGRDAINRYAVLRATGHEIVPSFAYAFGSVIVGPLDDIRIAAASFEQTALYRVAYEEATARLGPAVLHAEYEDRMSEAARDIPPIPLSPESLSPEERDRRTSIDREEAKKLATFVESVQAVLREQATNDAVTIDGARGAAELFSRSAPNRNW